MSEAHPTVRWNGGIHGRRPNTTPILAVTLTQTRSYSNSGSGSIFAYLSILLDYYYCSCRSPNARRLCAQACGCHLVHFGTAAVNFCRAVRARGFAVSILAVLHVATLMLSYSQSVVCR